MVVGQVVNVEGMMELENHFPVIIAILNSGKNH